MALRGQQLSRGGKDVGVRIGRGRARERNELKHGRKRTGIGDVLPLVLSSYGKDVDPIFRF